MPEPDLRPSKPKFFYGWIMLGVAIAMAVATMPTQTIVVAIFNDSLREALGLDAEELSRAYTIGTILAAFPLPWIGRMADKHGLRPVVFVVAIGCASAVAMLTRAPGLAGLAAIFFFMRLFGQGALGMLAGHTIAMWFERRLGTAHALLAILGFAGGSALMPAPTAWMIEHHGWRTAALVLSGMILLLTIPAVLLIFRNKPEDISQRLDGDPTEHESHDVLHGGAPPKNDPAFTRGQAMRTRAYWILVPIMCSTGLIGTALLFHMQGMLRSAGLEGTESQTAIAVQPWPIAFGVSMLALGWLVDRLPPRRLLPFGPALMLVSVTVCLLGVSGRVPEEWTVATMAVGMGIFGVSMGVSVAVGNPAIARYFGRTHHGAIRGTITLASVAATGVGPWLTGGVYELAGKDFVPILTAFAAAGVPLGIASLFLSPPPPPEDRDQSHPAPDEPDPIGPDA